MPEYRLTIETDDYADSPAEWGNTDLFIVSGHRYFSPRHTTPDNTEDYHTFPVDVYAHSGVWLTLAGDPGYRCPWDTARGAATVYVRKGVEWPEGPEAAARSLVEEWNMYVSGDVWRYSIERVTVCPCCGSEQVEEVDSLSGIYGEGHAREEGNGMLEWWKAKEE